MLGRGHLLFRPLLCRRQRRIHCLEPDTTVPLGVGHNSKFIPPPPLLYPLLTTLHLSLVLTFFLPKACFVTPPVSMHAASPHHPWSPPRNTLPPVPLPTGSWNKRNHSKVVPAPGGITNTEADAFFSLHSLSSASATRKWPWTSTRPPPPPTTTTSVCLASPMLAFPIYYSTLSWWKLPTFMLAWPLLDLSFHR